jgi:hypothetical protein
VRGSCLTCVAVAVADAVRDTVLPHMQFVKTCCACSSGSSMTTRQSCEVTTCTGCWHDSAGTAAVLGGLQKWLQILITAVVTAFFFTS